MTGCATLSGNPTTLGTNAPCSAYGNSVLVNVGGSMAERTRVAIPFNVGSLPFKMFIKSGMAERASGPYSASAVAENSRVERSVLPSAFTKAGTTLSGSILRRPRTRAALAES